jgi:heme oxygenase
MIHELLKQSSRACHASLENKLRLLVKDEISITQYAAVIEKFYGVYRPIEKGLSSIDDWGDPEFNLHRRLKLPLLVKDLSFLSVEPEAIERLPRCEDIPDLKTVSEALGCLYVLEGSTLGGRVITGHLRRSLQLDENRGCAFFSSYGEGVGQMWSSFLCFLEGHCDRHGETDVVVQSACKTFASLEKWFSDVS